MTEDLQRDLRELPPPSLDVPTDFYERVMHRARRRQRVMVFGSTGLAAAVVAPNPSSSLPPISLTSLPTPSCQSGYLPAGTLTTVSGFLHCVPAAYLPRAGYACPAGSEFATSPAPLCFTSATKDTIVAPVPSS